ncbi:MAG: hypothetical protein LBN33_00195 [Desulfovibrio sp.]|jgi:dolichyl-diphosphooligosaccharide--protein glycosyltransferase|nr:hypothetical protein [Desulfovibrio sp.]
MSANPYSLVFPREFLLSSPPGRPKIPALRADPAPRAAGICLLLTFVLSVAARLLELPFWDNPAFHLGDEYLLATHDAYHWVAGAEGFEFGAGHPMSELARLLSLWSGLSPAQVAFYLPPFMSALAAVGVFLWCAGLNRPWAGLCAGVLCSLSPGFCARTLLGFYDTDLVILLFALLLGLIPALWLSPLLRSPLEALCPRFCARFNPGASEEKTPNPERAKDKQNPPSPLWLLPLILSGIFGHAAQDWHSLFPYLARFYALLLPSLILLLGPKALRRELMACSLCHVLPLLLGPCAGLPLALLCAFILAFPPGKAKSLARAPRFLLDLRVLSALWALALFAALDNTVFENMLRSFIAYTQRGGDLSPLSAAGGPLIFPSVSQSIIEVQTISVQEMLLYVYPFELLTLLGIGLFVLRLFTLPALIWLAPLFTLYLLSLNMGARMTMFGAAVIMPTLCLEAGRVLDFVRGPARADRDGLCSPAAGPARWAFCLFCALCLSWPLIRYIPDYSQGPIFSREQAEGLSFLKENSAEDAMIWNWWDWGYATHHFARRHTIADGARHGGPSLFLPAAVYTTADPRFARQLIKYTASKGNIPGNVFAGLTPKDAQQLMRDLGDRRKALLETPGEQYLVVSFELLHLGLWITRYGSWNFESKQAPGSLMNNLAPALQYNIDTGVVLSDTARPIYAATISIFSDQGLEFFDFNRYGAYHFIFNSRSSIYGQDDKDGVLHKFWANLRGKEIFSGQITDKIVMDDVFYNTMLVQLLVRPPDDPFTSPYFKLVFDNTYTRIYKVL